MRSDNKNLKYHAAFTLIELIVVILIIGIISSVIFSTSADSSEINLNSEAELVVSDIQRVQNLSMTRNVRYAFTRVSSTSYTISTISGGNTITKSLPAGITFGNFNNLPNNLVAFNGRGVPYVDASLPGTLLSNQARIRLTANRNTVVIRIRPDSGQVYIQ